MKSTVVHSKPVVEVRGEVELLDKTLLGKRFKPAFFEQDCDTNSFSLVEGRTTSSYSLSSVQKLHTEGDIVVIGVGGGGTTVAFRVLDGAMASRWVNLLAQWVSYLRQVSLGQVLGEASSGGNTALGNSGGLRDTSAGGVSDIVFQSGGAKAFGGVWDDDLFLKLRGRVLQYHRAEEDDDVLGYVACSGISGVSQLGLRDDGRMHVVRIMFRSASERPWELGFDTRTLAQEWQRVLMSMSGGASLLATMGRQVGKKIFKKKEDSFGSSSLNAGFVGTPFNVTKQTPLSPRKPASLQGENEQQQVRGGWNSKQPSQLGEERKKEKEQERKEREMKSKAKESEQYSTYGDIDVDVLRLQLEEDGYSTLVAPDMEAPSPMVVWGEGDDDENGGFLPEDDEGLNDCGTAVFDMGRAEPDSYAEESVAAQLQRVLSVYESSSELSVHHSSASVMLTDDMISLGETLQAYLEQGDSQRLRSLSTLKPQPNNAVELRQAVAKAASQSGLSQASAMLRLREELEKFSDDPELVDYSLLRELPPRPNVLPPPERPIARQNARSLMQAHKARKMLGQEAPVASSSVKKPDVVQPARSPRFSPRLQGSSECVPGAAVGRGRGPAAAAAVSPPQISSSPPPLPPKPKVVPKLGRSPPTVKKKPSLPKTEEGQVVELVQPEEDR